MKPRNSASTARFALARSGHHILASRIERFAPHGVVSLSWSPRRPR
jgi:hypothetical protein